jgi:hypothetical protein
MTSAALTTLEALLQARKLDGTLLRPRETEPVESALPTGFAPLDAALGGGWRPGEISELVGDVSAGRTSVLISTLANATASGGLVGLVDVQDRFDPISAAAGGVDLDRMLWVRGGGMEQLRSSKFEVRSFASRAIRALDLIVRAGGFAVVALDAADGPDRLFRALPHTVWMRLARANAGRQTSVLLLAPVPLGRSARGATVRLEASSRWSGSSRQSRRLAALAIRARIAPSGREASFDVLLSRP